MIYEFLQNKKTLQKQQKKINRHDNDGEEENGDEENEDEITKDGSNTKSKGKTKLGNDGDNDSEEDEEETEGTDLNFGVAKKSEQQRRLEKKTKEGARITRRRG